MPRTRYTPEELAERRELRAQIADLDKAAELMKSHLQELRAQNGALLKEALEVLDPSMIARIKRVLPSS